MDLSLISAAFALFLSIVLSVYYLPSLLKTRNDENPPPQTPPGSTGLPLIGETLSFLSYTKKGIAERFPLDRMEKYSSKVIKTSLFGETVAVLCGPEANKFIYSNENKVVKVWRPLSTGKLFGAIDKNHYEMVAIKRRKLFSTHYLSVDALQKYVPIMDSGTKQHLQTYWEGKDSVTAHPLAKLYTFTLATRLFLGIEDTDTVASIREPFGEIYKGLHSLPLNFPGTSFNYALKAKKKINIIVNAWVKKWKSDFLEGRLSASQSTLANILNQTFQEDDISDIFLTLLAGAYETTSWTLSCIIMFLAQLPHVYDKVLAEQKEIANSKKGDTLNWGDIQKMKYTWNVACESLRLLMGDASFREAKSDFTYEGFLIPKGWKVLASQSATHRNPKYFEDPKMFDTSRFEGDGPPPYSFVPFGGGPRMCPAKEYARIKILVFVHNLVTKFKWEQVFPNEEGSSTPTAMPSKGLPIYIYPHKS